VSAETVSRWLARARTFGPTALLAHPSPGHPSELSAAQRHLIPEFLWHGPEAYGFRGQVWTCGRVAKVIEREFGVGYHKGHVARLLRELCWSPQMPIRRAIQRDEEAIARWRNEVFYLLPGLVKTYAPIGQTPVLREKVTRDHLSVMGGMTPRGKIYTLARQESLNGLHVMEFLVHLLRVTGKRLLVVWDGSPIHRRAEVSNFVSDVRGKIAIEVLPGYAPDLNPWDEGGWQHLKHVEMRNIICPDLEELHQQFHLAVGRLRMKPRLVQSFFAQAGLKWH
jgi:transposase